MNYNNVCYRCFFEKSSNEIPCPRCGYKHSFNAVEPNCLMPGTLLKKRYIVGLPLGVGGFGITYKCLDTQIGGICAIKEYFPSSFAVRVVASNMVTVHDKNQEKYKRLLKRFVDEAELVKKLRHRNIIAIYDSFFENNTAYYAMEYCDGIDLRKYTNNFTKKISYEEGMNLLYQTMNGLEYIHSQGIMHRDIAPDNIYITNNNTIKILDFGAARSEMDQLNRELSVIVKVGYAPLEQYGGRGKQGPYTDIYALGATFYHLFTSRIPLESTQRVAEDTLVPFSVLRPDLPDNLKFAIEKSMELMISKRIPNIPEMKRILGLDNVSVTQPNRKKRPPINNVRAVAKQQPNSAMASNKSVNKVQNYDAVFKADFTKRMFAYLLDCIVWGICGIIISALFGMAYQFGLLFPVILTICNIISEIATSKTPGKAMLGLYVRDRVHGKASVGQIIGRNLIKLLGIFVVVFSKEDNLLEDMASDSIVCEER